MLTWQQQVKMLLNTTNKEERQKLIQFLNEKTALSGRTDKTANAEKY